jgi:hypothetical protein
LKYPKRNVFSLQLADLHSIKDIFLRETSEFYRTDADAYLKEIEEIQRTFRFQSLE